MAKIKVGVFGAYRGMTMISVLADHPDAELVAVCDKFVPALDKVRALAEEHHIHVDCYEDFEDFFRADMDAVVLANYANEHAPFAVRLLNSGRHVMSEVLPCENMAQAVELIEAVEKSGKVYAYAENYCYMWHTFEMWRRYKHGDIGEITYAEGEYIHDCSAIWPSITYGEKDHWRNNMFPYYYCTHSLGPMLAISGLRPVRVTGMSTPPSDIGFNKLGCRQGDGVALEMVTLENGAILKSIHGTLKREPGSVNYEVYGTKGSMESQRLGAEILNVYREGEKLCVGEWENYKPEPFVSPDLAKSFKTHGGSDFYATHFFLQKILGRPEGDEWSIDVYKAVDMGICGILAYRSALLGNIPVEVPDLRDPKQRERFRYDTSCTNPRTAGAMLLPNNEHRTPDISPEVYENVRKLWLEGKNAE